MSTRTPRSGRALAASIATIILSCAPVARSVTYTWDADPILAGIQDGIGTWNTTTTNWFSGGSNVAWVNDVLSEAAFGGTSGTAGTVNLSAEINLGTLTFNTTGYTLAGSPLNFAGASTISAAPNITATITSSILSAGTGLTKTGAGTVVLRGNNAGLTGPVIVNGGTLAVDGNQNTNRLPANAAVAINNGGTFEIQGVNALATAGNAVDFTVAAGGTLRFVTGGSVNAGVNGASHAHTRNITLNGGTIELGYSGAGTAYNEESFQLNGDITVGGTTVSTVNVINGATNGLQGIAFAGTRTITVNDVTGSDAGDFIVNGELENNDAGNSGMIKAGAGTLVLAGDNSYSGGTTIAAGTLQVGNGGATGSMGTGSVSNNGRLDFGFGTTGTIANVISGSGIVRQIGTGSTLFTGTGNYSGATQVNAGKLFVNGSLAASTAVAVAAGATLGGSGTVSGTVTVNNNGLIESGNGSGIGTLTIGTLTLGATAGNTMAFKLTPQTGIPAVVISAPNGLIANGGAGSAAINIASVPGGIGTYTLIDYNGTLGGGFGAFALGTLPPRVIANLVNNGGATSIDLNVTGIDFPIWSGALNGTWSTATLAAPKNWVLNSAPGTSTDFITNDSVVFNDTASGTTTVDINAGNVSPSSVTFNNTSKNYILNGTGGIAGSTGLTKSGGGTLTINTTNSFTGAVSITGGAVSIPSLANTGVASALGAGSAITLGDAIAPVALQITGTTSATNRPLNLNAGGAIIDIFQAAGTHTQNAIISGPGGIQKVGPGTLVLNALNTYSGNTVVDGGILQLAASNSGAGVGAIVGQLTINTGGTVRTTAPNTLGWNGAQQIFTLNINGGLLDNTAAGDQGWAITINLNGGTMQSNGGVSSATTNQLFALGGGSSVNSLPNANPSVIAGRINIREANPGDILAFTVADGAAQSDLLVSAAMVTTAAFGISKNGDGKMVVSGESTYAGPTNINAGILQVGDGGAGGTLGNGAGVVTNNAVLAFNLTGAKTIGNPITGTGTLQQNGVGSVILTGSADYTGPTQVNAGKLFINSTLPSSPVTVAAGGSFGGSGFVTNTVSVANGGAIESGNGSGIGTLTLNTLALGTAAGHLSSLNLAVNVGVPSLAITAADGLLANGGAQSVTINVLGLAPALGVYTLVDYNGVLGGTYNAFKLGTLPPRTIGNLVNNPGNTSIDFQVTGTDFPIWSGKLNSTWSTAVLADPKNWVLNSNLATATDYIAGDSVVFGDSADGTAVDISNGNVTPSLVNFVNSTKDYTLTGTNGIAGGIALNKSGTGTLTISNTNSFTGPVNITDGTVSVSVVGNSGVASPLGAGSSIVLGGLSTAGALRFTGLTGTTNRPITLEGSAGTIEVADVAGALTQSGILSGVGALVKRGAGLLTLSTANSTFTGDVFIEAGTVTVPAITGSAATTSALGAKNSTRTISVGGTGTLNMTVNNVFGGGGMNLGQIPKIVIGPGGTVSATRFNTLGDIVLNGGTLTQAATDGPGAYEGYQFIGTIQVGGNVPSTITTTNGKANHLLGGGNTTFDVADVTASNAGDLIVSVPLRDGSGDYQGVSTLTKIGAGTMVLAATNIYTGTTTISGGTLQLGNGGTAGAIGAGQVFNDGTLAFNLTGTRTFGNQISGSGGVRQAGSGTVILTGANSYGGPTVVDAGRLFINGFPQGLGTYTVNAGGTLGSDGNLTGAVTVNHNGTIESGNGNGVGTFNVGSITLGATIGDRSTFQLFATPNVPAVVVGSLTANGGANSSTINVGGAAPAVGTYPLIDYTGVLGGGFGAFILGTLPPRVIGNISHDPAGTVINLNVTGTDFPIWTGALNGTWTTASQAAPKNWVQNSNAATTDYINGDSVLFNDSAIGTTTLDITGGNVSPAAVTFENSTKDYALTGTSGIAGSGGITKFGTGKVTIGTINSFTGPMRISAGTVSVGIVANAGLASPLGAGPLFLGEATTNGTLEFTGIGGSSNRPITLGTGGGTLAVTQAGATLTQSGALSGDGGLTKSGPGTLALTTNTSTFSGNVVVNGGLITVPAINGSGDTFSALGSKASSRTITVNDTAELRFTVNNVFGGGGMGVSQIPELVINQGGTLSSTRFNTLGNVTLNGGTLTQAATDGPGVYEGYQFIGTVTVGGSAPSNITTTNGRANHLLGGLNTIFNVADATGTSAPDLIVSAPIAEGSGDYGGQGSLTKSGVGTMQISSVSTYTGPTTVNAGTLQVTGSITGSAFTVLTDATLGGTGITGSVQVADGGAIAPGVGVGTLSTGSLTLSALSELEFQLGLPGVVGGNENDLLTISGDLTLDGMLQVIAGTGFGQGTYRLASYSGTLNNGGLDLDSAFLTSFPGSHIDTNTLGEVNLVVVPEPGSAVLLLGSLLILGRRNRATRTVAS